jgi:hypothetical protein
MSYKIIKNKDFLHKKTEPVSSIQEGQEIADKLDINIGTSKSNLSKARVNMKKILSKQLTDFT